MPKGESNNGNRNMAASHLPALVEPRLVKALNHVLRQHIMLAAVQGEVSPNELSKALDEGLSQVSYHVKVLRDDCDGMIEETRTEPRRGAVEHYYRATEKSLFPAKAWRRLRKGLRTVVGAGQASDLFNDLADALKAGKLQGTHDHITRTPLVLDAEGERNVKAIAERATKEVENEQRVTAKRREKANGDGGEVVGYTFALLAFEAAWEPADLRALVAQVEKVGAWTNSANGAGRNGSGKKMGKRKAVASTKPGT
ncbi:MAG TPA: winged helix-turn-helix domain-containing protein [Solirubrobacterales bacterium]|nr:winged helix-turn-helix domain-containing protein [Solirubrobacterales bacterium]